MEGEKKLLLGMRILFLSQLLTTTAKASIPAFPLDTLSLSPQSKQD